MPKTPPLTACKSGGIMPNMKSNTTRPAVKRRVPQKTQAEKTNTHQKYPNLNPQKATPNNPKAKYHPCQNHKIPRKNYSFPQF